MRKLDINKRLDRKFYNQSTLHVAKELLGKYIVRQYRNSIISCKIVETEAYIGPHDKGSHSFRNKRTKRTESMFLDGGYAYIYIVYGMYWMFNVSTAGKENPEAILIRAVEPTVINEAISSRIASGPGKLCKYLKINKSLDKEDLVTSKKIWLEDRGVHIPINKINRTSRIGIDYAGPVWSKKPWRFYVKNSEFVSRK